MKSTISEEALLLSQTDQSSKQIHPDLQTNISRGCAGTFPASSAACRVRAGCFPRSSPRHSCGGTEIQRVLLAALNVAGLTRNLHQKERAF